MRKQFLFLGIGGMGMAPLALYLRQQGHTIYGFDDGDTSLWGPIFEREEIIICTQFPKSIDLVVYSSAIAEAHPWRQMATRQGIQQIKRGQLLAQFCRDKKMIAVTGSHGKTTTTGLLIDHLPECGYILGGYFQDSFRKSPAQYRPDDPYLICEVDESDRTVEDYHPDITVALNLEDDHLVNYGNSAQLDATFQTLFQNTRGVVIFPENDSRLYAIADRAGLHGKIIDHVFFGSSNSEIFDSLSEITWPQNDSLTENQRLAYAVLYWLHAKDPKIAIDFSHRQSNKIARRNQFLGTLDEVDYWSDYAHHPTEVLHCMRSMESRYKDVAFVFEPHRYTRTAQYAQEFADILGTRQVDLLPVYAAGEQLISSGKSETIFKKLPQQHNVRLIPHVRKLRKPNKKNQAVVLIGAGSIHAQAERWFREQRIESLIQWLAQENIPYQTNVSSRFFSSIHIAGQLRLLIFPNDKTQLMRLNVALKRYQVKWMLLGNGTNVLLDYDEGVFVSLRQLPREIQILENRVIASANLPLPYFCRCLAKVGIAGYASLAGIPGTLGGALRMNAGAYGQEIFNRLTELEVLPFNGNTLERHTKSMIKHSYRQGFRDGIILSAQFDFSQSQRQSPEEIIATMKCSRTRREQSQPREPNIGCIFKNPPQSSAGSLVDQCGLKSLAHGDAKVSERHANFIVNTGNATPDDVKYLLKTCRQKVFETYGVYLRREILFASDFF